MSAPLGRTGSPPDPLDVPADPGTPFQPRSGRRGSGFLTEPLRWGSTPSATVGPYLAIGLTWADGEWAAAEGTPGGFWLRGRVLDGAGGVQAPHIDVSVFARGLLDRVVTRVYFADEAAANATDPVLAALPEDRRATLLARPAEDGYRFDVHLQGEHETVFFAL